MNRQNKTICMITAQYLPHVGGVERYTYEVAKELRKRGCRVIIVTSQIKGSPVREYTKEGIEIQRVWSIDLMKGRFPVAVPIRLRARLARMMENEEVGLAVIHTRFYPLSLAGARAAHKAGVRCIVVEHGSAYVTMNNRILDLASHIYERAVTRVIKKTRCEFYGVSSACEEWLSRLGIKSSGRLYNAVDYTDIDRIAAKNERVFSDRFGIPAGEKVVAFVGRLVPEKGVIPMIRAFEKVAEETKSHLVLAGEGPLLDEAKALAGPRTHLLGQISYEEVAQLLLESDIYVLPSRSEGFSTSLLEAVACGCLPVSTRVGGAAELIREGKNGVFLAGYTESDIGEGLEKAFAMLKDSEKEREEAKARAREEFSFAKTADAMINIAKNR